MTYAFAKLSGLPENQILGSGTALDTARLRCRLSQHYGVSEKNIHAYVFGEHGDTSFVPWSRAFVAGATLDEFDKIAEKGRGGGPDVSREGVQRDILPIVEGATVNTKYGPVKTDHILFIAAGAFHVSKPSDLIPELQGRFPIRVELQSLTVEDFRKILTEPNQSLVKQYTSLLATDGLPDKTVNVKFKGSAGQSFGAFLTHGVDFKLEGECNDYFAKGLSGGRVSILPPIRSNFAAEDNIIAGNTGLYGATGGELYVNGKVGERFGVRNSGAIAVIEGAGDHCCEYMTGGRVVVLGETGRNFAAGMSGGVAYVWDKNHNFDYFCNMDMVEINLVDDSSYRKELHELIRQHYLYTGSKLARTMLDDWNRYVEDFIQVVPIEYKRVLQEEQVKKLQQKIADMQRDY